MNSLKVYIVGLNELTVSPLEGGTSVSYKDTQTENEKLILIYNEDSTFTFETASLKFLATGV